MGHGVPWAIGHLGTPRHSRGRWDPYPGQEWPLMPGTGPPGTGRSTNPRRLSPSLPWGSCWWVGN